ncbi:carbohydrate kinase [Paenibacillus sp. FSL H8-0548]|uniref:carbohydrate kinase family protein n=1 Tax=Paenibacillus sp. FSL H8-0548 TaxID=1920422 RepID=UPI00096E95F8|nr:carbohydrate kinase [Paenibacillus sp. FSL H8-0548]OMF35885.1 carbohydrate kinase [Paenibacillus sp. FSL H8-0548]
MSKLYTIGEALIDFIPDTRGIELKNVTGFTKEAGGAPANVACVVAKLGGSSAFIGKLGIDAFGDFLVETMQAIGVDTSHVFRTNETNTALAFVSLKADGDRDFSFYRNPSADMLLSEDEIDGEWFAAGDILHYCSVDLIEAPVKYAHLRAIEAMKAAGGMISFDPNVRLPLWADQEQCRQTILEFIPLSHLVKISSDELSFITGIENEKEAIASLFVGDVQAVVYTKGSEGAVWHTPSYEVSVPGQKVIVKDTTGAGDAFIGALLYQLQIDKGTVEGLTAEHAKRIVAFANAAAALTTTRAGAISSLPELHELPSL